MSENLNGLSEHVAAGVSMIVHHHVKSSRCPALLVLEISRGSGWKRCVAIRVDLYEVCFPLTNCYFPCLRSNGCGGITLQLKTTKSLFTRTSFSTPVPCHAVIPTVLDNAKKSSNAILWNATQGGKWLYTNTNMHKHTHTVCATHVTQKQTYTHACTHMFSAFLSNYLTATEGWARMITVINCNWI